MTTDYISFAVRYDWIIEFTRTEKQRVWSAHVAKNKKIRKKLKQTNDGVQ